MSDNDINKIQDVRWESIDEDAGKIKFRNKKRGKSKALFGVIAVIVVSTFAGGMAGAYVVERKYASANLPQTNAPIISQKNFDSSNTQLPKNSITKVAETVGPAVVGISNRVDGFFGMQEAGSGSGIIFKPEGYIVTNYHVISNADRIFVKLASGKTLEAKLVGDDPRTDLAVIKISAENLPYAKFGDSSKVKVGDVAIAIGNPLGDEFAGSVTAGIISALNRKIKYEGAIYKVLQTDAAINPGNSGGALCNEAGEVIGINSLKLGAETGAEGMGFAISINEAKNVIDSLITHGKVVSRPYVGIYGETISSEKNKIKGVYVKEVVKGSGAAAAGIKPTDIIIELDGKKITRFEDIGDVTDGHKIGDTIGCKLWRNGDTTEVKITLLEVKDNK